MTFPISTFEVHIPSDITQKGLNYFVLGQVSSLVLNGNSWSAAVNGTQPYSVKIEVEKGNVTQWACDCPYDHGPICKHVTAVMWAILNDTLKEVAAPKGGIKR
ncbi:MAG: SWIM zinc finger family protein [Saprospiraceae bacterium]